MDLSGEWIGHYPGHYDEVIEICHSGNSVVATKLTGDDHVPAGEITWRAVLPDGSGEGQIAGHDFHNPRFVPGLLTVLDSDHITFEWHGLGSVEYRRDL